MEEILDNTPYIYILCYYLNSSTKFSIDFIMYVEKWLYFEYMYTTYEIEIYKIHSITCYIKPHIHVCISVHTYEYVHDVCICVFYLYVTNT